MRKLALAWLIGACGSGSDSSGSSSSSGSQGSSAPVVAIADAGARADAAAKVPRPPPAASRDEHAVWNLVDNRHAVHRYLGDDIVIDASDIGLARYARFGVPVTRWHYGHSVSGERAAVADRLASLEVPIAEEQTRTINRLVARVNGRDKQVLSLRVNGKPAVRKQKDSRIALVEGWQTVTLPIEPGHLGIGENQFVFETTGGKGTVAFAWIRIGARDGTDDPRAAAGFEPKQDTIRLAQDASLIWYVTVPEGAHLVGEVDEGCRVEVRARASDGSYAAGVLAEGKSRVDLTAMAGKVVGLSLLTRECPRALIKNARITLHGTAPSAIAKGDPPKYIVLWVMDALRADKIPLFTPGARAQTPNLDELAKTSVVFRHYYVQGNESQTSHSSFWTSLYPAVHNVRLAGSGGTWRIDTRFDVLAAKLGDAGMYTLAVTGNGFVNEEGGYARGFRKYRNLMRESGVAYPILYGQQIVDTALKELDGHRDAPTYLFLGTVDTHAPWIARKPWIETYSPNYEGPFKDFATADDLGFKPDSMGCGKIPAKPDIERLKAIYESAISYQDAQLARFIKQLREWRIWDQTMLVITADHGDEFFEDGRCGHGGSLRDSLIRVPLLVHYPPRFPGGTIIDEGAEGVDIMPTMLDALGQPALDAAQGESLAPISRGIGRGWARPSYTSMFEYAHAMRIGRWKMRVGVAGVPMLDDLIADPDEKQDLSPKAPVERRMMTDNLGMFLALRKQWKKAQWGVVTNVSHAGAEALDGVMTP